MGVVMGYPTFRTHLQNGEKFGKKKEKKRNFLEAPERGKNSDN